jgi:hypothetical protein
MISADQCDYVGPNKQAPVVGHTYLQLLERFNPKLVWDGNTKEHSISIDDKKDSQKLYYPTLKVCIIEDCLTS